MQGEALSCAGKIGGRLEEDWGLERIGRATMRGLLDGRLAVVTLDGIFNVTHACLRQLAGTKGRIVNIGSIQSFMHVRTPNSPAYTTSKHGVLGFTRALAAELGRDAAQCASAGQPSRACESLRGPHAAWPPR